MKYFRTGGRRTLATLAVCAAITYGLQFLKGSSSWLLSQDPERNQYVSTSSFRNMSYAQCLQAHGKPVKRDHPTERWLLNAQNSVDAVARLDHLTQHIISVWLSTLNQRHGTPCQPTIVRYVCSGDEYCGGIGDRIRGIRLALWQAILTDSVFLIQWTRPVLLEEYFKPVHPSLAFTDFMQRVDDPHIRRISWRMHWIDALTLEQESAIVKGSDFVTERIGIDLVDVVANQPYLAELLQNPFLQASLQRYHLSNNSLSDFAYIAQRMFFSEPSALLARASRSMEEQLFHNPNALRIGIHIRLGDAYLSGHDIEGGDVSASDGERRYLIRPTYCFAREAIRQCNMDSPRPCVAFIASDSLQATTEVAEQLSTVGIAAVYINSPSSHIDSPAVLPNSTHYVDAVALHAKDFADWHMLTKMEALVMSHSGFSFSAALSALPQRAVWLQKKFDGKTCNFTDFNSAMRSAHDAQLL